MVSIHLSPIGHVRSPFKEKFGVPRQALMVNEARGIIKLNADPQFAKAVEDLHLFSHLWIIFLFNKNEGQNWRPTITPPVRVNGRERVSVFASRSPHRPNPIGMSAVKLDRIDVEQKDGIEIHISGLDILDGTPVLDIKPYLPFADSIQNANSGWAIEEVTRYKVSFAPEIATTLAQPENLELRLLLPQMLELDPRPTSQRQEHPIEDKKSEGRPYAFRILNFDVHWKIKGGEIYVNELVPLV